MKILPRNARAAMIIALYLAAGRGLSAQASPFIPLDDIAYRYVDALVARGMLAELPRLERPYRISDVMRGIDSARAAAAPPVGRTATLLAALEEAAVKYAPRRAIAGDTTAPFHATFATDLFATAQTSGRRELMLADDSSALRPGLAIRLAMQGGNVAAAIRGAIDPSLNLDPNFSGRKDRRLAGRTHEGYVSAQWSGGELFAGRASRNWGPAPHSGLQLSGEPYSYDHLYARIGGRSLNVAGVAARLEDLPSANGQIQRWFSAHRLAAKFRGLDIAITESFVYSGVGRGFEPALSNPFNLFALSWRNEGADGNLGLGGEFALRSRWGTISSQLYLDDVQIDECDTICGEPSSYAFSAGLEGLRVGGDVRGFASYRRVTSLAYRTPSLGETYSSRGIGLGEAYSDFDEIRGGLDVALDRTPLRVYAAFRRQGEGDYRSPFPLARDYATTPGFLIGTVSRIVRGGISGGTRFRDFEGMGDIGVNRVSNADRVLGRTRTGFEGRVKFLWTPRWSASF